MGHQGPGPRIAAVGFLLLGSWFVVAGGLSGSTDDTESHTSSPGVGSHHASADGATSTQGKSHKSPSEPDPAPRTHLVVRVIDGDTVELGNGREVRLVGIDSPERGECGYQAAADNLVRLVQGKSVRLTISDEDTDRYGRLLRYIDVGGVDAGLAQIKAGLAISRYDSRDGYGFHPREPVYIKADRGTKQFACQKPATPLPVVQATNCMAGYTPCLRIAPDLDCGDIGHSVIVAGSDPYRLDADGDGIGCDP